jgi:hypothetical protein
MNDILAPSSHSQEFGGVHRGVKFLIIRKVGAGMVGAAAPLFSASILVAVAVAVALHALPSSVPRCLLPLLL